MATRFEGSSEQRVLVVGPAWVGDMVMAHSLIQVLRARAPADAIDVLAPPWTLPLARRMVEVDRTLELPLGHGQLGLARRYRIGASLRQRGYRQAIVLPGSSKSALIPFWARIGHRTGYRGELRYGLLNDIRVLDRPGLPMMVQRFAALGLAAGAALPDPLPTPVLRVDPACRDTVLKRLGQRPPAGPLLALCPGAEFGPSKRWPAEAFAAVARRQRARGWEVWIFGSRKDTTQARMISDGLDGACVDLTGRTSLTDAVDLLSLADVVVSNDSGLMHVAAALDRRVVAVFGASDPAFTPPLHVAAQVLWLGLECSPCRERDCRLGHYRCLRELEPERVLAAIDAF